MHQPWEPTKAFYDANPRSKEIREACLPIIRSLKQLLDHTEEAEHVDKSLMYAQMEKYNERLIELGIEPKMHVGDDPQSFQSNPVKSAEYTASQLLSVTGRTIPSNEESAMTVGEFSDTDIGDEIHILSHKPPELRELAKSTGALHKAEQLFGITPEYL
jgi:hypothetical protein